MKNNIAFIFTGTLFIVACTSQPKDPKAEKKAKLEQLKKDQEKINIQIDSLQKQLGTAADSINALAKLVSVTPVNFKPFDHYIRTEALVQSDENVSVVPKTQGVFTAVYVKEGQRVRKGQSLAKIDDQILQRNLAQTQTQLDLARTLFDKRKKLWDQQIGTEVDYLQAKSTKDNLEAQMATFRQQIAQTVVTAPIEGTVDLVSARLGEGASPSFPAFRIVNLDVVKVTAGLSESYLGRVKEGASAVIEFPELNKTVNAKIMFVGESLDQASRTFAVQTKLYKMNIKPNTTAIMKILDYSNPKTIVLPSDVVQQTLTGRFVFLAKKDNNALTVLKKSVQIGLEQDGSVNITEGLKEGDQVITTGYRGLEDGQPIKL